MATFPGEPRELIPPPHIYQGLVSFREYHEPPPAEGVHIANLRPVCPYILPPNPVDYYNSFHKQCEIVLRSERKNIHDALLRPIGMTIDDLTPNIPGEFFRRRTPEEGTRVMMPRLLLLVHSEHVRRMNRVCRLSKRMNKAIKAMRRQHERVLSTILPLLPQVQDPNREEGVLMADVDSLVTPILREYMPKCPRLECEICEDFAEDE